MSTSTKAFKETIQQYLEKRAAEDPLFAETMKKKNKNIDGCVNYIFSEVQRLKCNGFADEEIFGMAVHYYDEDDLKAGSNSSMRVVVNHTVELTEEDKAAAKAKAMEELVESSKEEARKELAEKIELSAEDIELAKKKAIEKIALEQKEKLTKRAEKKQLKDVSSEKTEVEPDLFS